MIPLYFATVRRAMSMPVFLRASASSSSLSGLALSSASMTSRSLAFTASQAMSWPLGVGGAAGEEHSQRENAPRRLHVLAGHRAADRRDVNADLAGHVRHRQRPQGLRAVFQEVPLDLEDFLDHAADGLAPLLDGLDEPLGRADVLADELAGLACRPCGPWPSCGRPARCTAAACCPRTS